MQVEEGEISVSLSVNFSPSGNVSLLRYGVSFNSITPK